MDTAIVFFHQQASSAPLHESRAACPTSSLSTDNRAPVSCLPPVQLSCLHPCRLSSQSISASCAVPAGLAQQRLHQPRQIGHLPPALCLSTPGTLQCYLRCALPAGPFTGPTSAASPARSAGLLFRPPAPGPLPCGRARAFPSMLSSDGPLRSLLVLGSDAGLGPGAAPTSSRRPAKDVAPRLAVAGWPPCAAC